MHKARKGPPLQFKTITGSLFDVRAQLLDLLGSHADGAIAQALPTKLSTSPIASSFNWSWNCDMR
jgi:hypothetical protein